MAPEFRYSLTRICLRTGQLSLSQRMADVFPESGTFRAFDTVDDCELELRVSEPRKVSGVAAYLKRHHLDVNDEIQIRTRDDGRIALTAMPRRTRRLFDDETMSELLDSLVGDTPMTEAEIRALHPQIPNEYPLAQALEAHPRMSLRGGRWAGEINEVPDGEGPPAPAAEVDRETALGQTALDESALDETAFDETAFDETAFGAAAFGVAAFGETTFDEASFDRAAFDPGASDPGASDPGFSDPGASGEPLNQGAPKQAPSIGAPRVTTEIDRGSADNDPEVDDPDSDWVSGWQETRAQDGLFSRPAAEGERRSSSAEGRSSRFRERGQPGRPAAVTPYPRGVLFPGEAALNSQRPAGDLRFVNRAREALVAFGYRVEGLPHGMLRAKADLGRRKHAVLVRVLADGERLDWAALLARRREQTADHLAVFGDHRDLHRLTAPAELARATLWSWDGIARIRSLAQTVLIGPFDLEPHFAKDGMFETGLEKFERKLGRMIADKGTLSAVITRLASLRAPAVFVLDDLVEGNLQREQVAKALELLAQAPFHLVARIDRGEYCLRHSVAESLAHLSEYALSLGERVPGARGRGGGVRAESDGASGHSQWGETDSATREAGPEERSALERLEMAEDS